MDYDPNSFLYLTMNPLQPNNQTMTCRSLARLFLCLFAFFTCFARSQFQQDYIKQNNGRDLYFYQPTVNDAPELVMDSSRSNVVVLTYNCFYMIEVCKNELNFRNTARGQNLHPLSAIPYGRFAYDLNNRKRKKLRRRHSCPGSWKNHHPCPEPDQSPPMRHDGPWFTTALEPGATQLVLKHHRDIAGKVDKYSKIMYTCDEFPPATWVEGGDGEDADQPAETRCAALRCMLAAKAEQDWQGLAHGVLRNELVKIIGDRQRRLNEFPSFRVTNSVIFFDFRTHRAADGVAARVITYDVTSPGSVKTQNKNLPINQGFTRRGETAGNANATVDDILSKKLLSLSYEELRDLMERGSGAFEEHKIHANHSNEEWTVSAPSMSLGIQAVDNSSSWEAGEAGETEEATEDDTNGNESIWSNLTQWNVQPEPRTPQPPPVPRSILANAVTPLTKRATAQDLARAQTLVSQAVAESARRNGQRLARPLHSVYGLRSGFNNEAVTPVLRITDEIADAAALVAEADSRGMAVGRNTTAKRTPTTPALGTYWMQGLARKGTVPWGNNASYAVFRNVLDYGAVGDGVTDDTKAINNAMTSGGRCGEKCNGSTTKNAIVYFPPGRYLISSSVLMPFGTQVIGDAVKRPTLVAASRFVGLGVLSTDKYTGGDGGNEEYYVNTANFYRQIRNVAIDITGAGANISCLHYQVAQATSLQNVELIASTDTAKNQIGMFAENGSGGQISDVTFTGGNIGFYGGNQQFTAQRLVFRGCHIGVHVIWDWGWVWKSVRMTNVDVGFRLAAIDSTGNIGSVSVMDSAFGDIHTAVVVIAPPTEVAGSGSTGLVLENVALAGVKATVVDTNGTILLDGSSAMVRSWVLGTKYEGNATTRGFSRGGPVGDHRRNPGLLDASGAYFERAKPQYEDKSVADFVHIKDVGATGDGSTDDTAAFQAAVYASLGKILFIDAGSYILTSTIVIPPGAKIVGETWSQLVASGAHFADASKPQVLIQVGQVGSVGSVEMQDLLFTTRGPTAGLILVEWNIQADAPGSAGLWDCHARIGGATGTQLTPAECPPSTSGIDAGCSAASLMMRLTSKASGYFENMWLWGADHMIDDPDLSSSSNDMEQCSIYIARGFLLESTQPTWLYGTASEHSVFYQYNFHNAANIFAGMLQTESPYFQPTPPPPAPFGAVVGNLPGDPTFVCGHGNGALTGCGASWSTIITGSKDIFVAAAGVYSWFSTYTQTCIDKQQCQDALVRLDNNGANVRIQNLVTIGATYMAVMDGQGIAAAPNLNVNTHPFWSLVTVLDVGHNGKTDFTELVWIDPKIWDMPQPSFTCVAPCHVQLPPYPGPTRTVNYPLLTVSSGTWTSTITQPPITISEWVLEVVTLAEGAPIANRKRSIQGFSAFRPVPATTPYWPAVAYTGNDGQRTTTAPSQPFPTPPLGIMDKDIKPWQGPTDSPDVGPCDFFGFDCIVPPWMYNPKNVTGTKPTGSGDDPGPADYDEDADELAELCPPDPTVTPMPIVVSDTPSSTTKTTTSTSAPPSLPTGDPTTNRVDCYNSGENTENQRMLDAATQFCNAIALDAIGPGYSRDMGIPFPYISGHVGYVQIDISLNVYPNCTWKYNLSECKRYLGVPDDSCNCEGIDRKQGGVLRNNCYTWRIDPNRMFEK